MNKKLDVVWENGPMYKIMLRKSGTAATKIFCAITNQCFGKDSIWRNQNWPIITYIYEGPQENRRPIGSYHAQYMDIPRLYTYISFW